MVSGFSSDLDMMSDDDILTCKIESLHVSVKMTLISVSTTGQIGILSAWTGDERGLWQRAKAVKVKCPAGQIKSDAELAKCGEPVSSSRSELAALKTEALKKVVADGAGKVLQEQRVKW